MSTQTQTGWRGVKNWACWASMSARTNRRSQLKRLARIASACLVFIVVPGASLLLPALALTARWRCGAKLQGAKSANGSHDAGAATTSRHPPTDVSRNCVFTAPSPLDAPAQDGVELAPPLNCSQSWVTWGDRREHRSSNTRSPSGGPSGESVPEGRLCVQSQPHPNKNELRFPARGVG